MEPHDRIDPKCQTAEASGKAIEATLDAEGLTGEAYAREFLKRYKDFAVDHVRRCDRCRSYQPDEETREENTRSPIWGGATVGLLVGLVVGFFRDNYWQTLLYGIGVGAAIGLAVNVLAAVLNRRRKW